MIEIIPAVLAKNFKELERQIEHVRGLSKLVQIDVVDGAYARGRTWPYRDTATFEHIVQQEHGLPHWEELDFEFDLMIEDPLAELTKYVNAGASSIIIHAAGVRVGVTSSTPQAWRESAGARSFEEAPDLVAEVLEVIRADAGFEDFFNHRGEVGQ